MRRYKIFALIICMTLISSFLSVDAASNSNPTIAADTVVSEHGGSVSVPIRLSGNTGICGATLSVGYDKNLVLTKIEKGGALAALTMTNPGNLSANPINLVWDGLEPDTSNGVVAVLTFAAPNAAGTYPVSVSYEDGDILDGNIAPIPVITQNGGITITAAQQENTPTLSIDRVVAQPGTSVSVPIRISGNTGICGATVSVRYDENLSLNNIEKGTALTGLTFTKPGNLSANPVNLVWDGLEADITNGVVATLTFTAPNKNGVYNISLSYEDGDILDGNILPINVKTISGEITVGSVKSATVEIAGKSVRLTNNNSTDGQIIVAFYNSAGRLISSGICSPTSSLIKIDEVPSGASVARVMWWENGFSMNPLCNAQIIVFNK